MLRRKLMHLEQLARRRPAPEELVVMTAAESVQALRAILGRVHGCLRRPPHDPFPTLNGEGWLLAFWPWLLAHGGPWPPWGQAAALRIAGAYLRAAGLVAADLRLTPRGERAWELLPAPAPVGEVGAVVTAAMDGVDDTSLDVDW